eukprot:366278-Chlamydomonas_euryale.AAC.67
MAEAKRREEKERGGELLATSCNHAPGCCPQLGRPELNQRPAGHMDQTTKPGCLDLRFAGAAPDPPRNACPPHTSHLPSTPRAAAAAGRQEAVKRRQRGAVVPRKHALRRQVQHARHIGLEARRRQPPTRQHTVLGEPPGAQVGRGRVQLGRQAGVTLEFEQALEHVQVPQQCADRH